LQVQKSTQNQKKFWSFVKSFTKKKSQLKFEIFLNGLLITDPKILTDCFADFFLSKVTDLSNKSNPCQFVLPNIFNIQVRESDFFTKLAVKTSLKASKSSKAQGVDEVPSIVLKDLSIAV